MTHGGYITVWILEDGGCRHFGFDRTGNSAIWSAVPEISILEPKNKNKNEVDRMTRRWDIAIRNFPNERSVGRR